MREGFHGISPGGCAYFFSNACSSSVGSSAPGSKQEAVSVLNFRPRGTKFFIDICNIWTSGLYACGTIRGLGWNVKVFTPPCCMYLIRVLFFACFFWYPCVSAPSVAKTSTKICQGHTLMCILRATHLTRTQKSMNLQWRQKVGYQLDHPASVQCVPCAESYE